MFTSDCLIFWSNLWPKRKGLWSFSNLTHDLDENWNIQNSKSFQDGFLRKSSVLHWFLGYYSQRVASKTHLERSLDPWPACVFNILQMWEPQAVRSRRGNGGTHFPGRWQWPQKGLRDDYWRPRTSKSRRGKTGITCNTCIVALMNVGTCYINTLTELYH